MARHRQTPVPKRNISESLHKTWFENKRKGDVEKIMEKAKMNMLPASKPTIEKAVLYGHCLDEKLRDLITDYFIGRNKGEDEQAKNLKNS